jgi:hypothetical protein
MSNTPGRVQSRFQLVCVCVLRDLKRHHSRAMAAKHFLPSAAQKATHTRLFPRRCQGDRKYSLSLYSQRARPPSQEREKNSGEKEPVCYMRCFNLERGARRENPYLSCEPATAQHKNIYGYLLKQPAAAKGFSSLGSLALS